MKTLKAFSSVLLVLTFAMIILGGVVHNTGSSLACPDWPLCFGQVFPKMQGEVAVEHSHRLLGTLIGFLCIALVVLTFRFARSLFKISLVLLVVVIFQGVLGGVTVLLRLSPLVSTAHLATSQIFLALVIYYRLRLTRLATPRRPPAVALDPSSFGWMAITTFVVFTQMCLGAFIRHGGASVACGLGRASTFVCLDSVRDESVLWPTTGPAQMNMLHRFMGIAVAALIIFATMPTLRYAKRHGLPAIRRLIIASHLTVCVQVALGFLTLWTMIQPVVVTLHLVFGVLLWIFSWTAFLLSKENAKLSLQKGSLKPKEVVLTT